VYASDQLAPLYGSDSRDAAFNIIQNVKYYGGFIGTEPSNYDVTLRNVHANQTILSGDLGVPRDNSDNSYHVLISAGPLGSSRLDGFTITSGSANGTGSITYKLKISKDHIAAASITDKTEIRLLLPIAQSAIMWEPTTEGSTTLIRSTYFQLRNKQ